MFDAATRHKIPANATLITDAATPIGYVWPDPADPASWCLYSPYNAGTILQRHGRSAAIGYVRGQHNRAKAAGDVNPLTGRN